MNDNAYLMFLTHSLNWSTAQINRLIIEVHNNRAMLFDEFFALSEDIWFNEFKLNELEIEELKQHKSKIPPLSLIADELKKQDIEIIAFFQEILKEFYNVFIYCVSP